MKGLAVCTVRPMRLRGTEYGHVLNASGARGFFGEGYWFHSPWKGLGLNYSGSTFVAKTTTLEPRAGNMPLKPKGDLWVPKETVPKCIVVKPVKGVVLNSVGLSGPGLLRLVQGWAALPKDQPAVFSVMSVAQDEAARLDEIRRMCLVLKSSSAKLPRSWALQVNLSCPNAGLDPSELVKEAVTATRLASVAGAPVMAKVNVLFPPEAAVELCKDKSCDGVVVSNTVPWGKLPEKIDWEGLFGSKKSPLAHLGGGGLSGKPLLPLVRDWLRTARAMGLRKPAVGGGGILSVEDAGSVLDAGATAVELGAVSVLRPWRVRGIIQYVNERCSR